MLHVHEEVESRADFVYVAVFHGKLVQADSIRVVDIQRLPMLHHFLLFTVVDYPVPVVTVVVLQENKLSVPENPVDARHVLPEESPTHDFQQVQVVVFLWKGVPPEVDVHEGRASFRRDEEHGVVRGLAEEQAALPVRVIFLA